MSLSIDINRRTLLLDERTFTREDEVLLNADIRTIEDNLLDIAVTKKWITKEGIPAVAAGYNSVGSNLYITNLSTLLYFDEDDESFHVDPVIAGRFTRDVKGLTPDKYMTDIAKYLRVRYGDYTIERYIDRLLKVYFDIYHLERDAEHPSLAMEFFCSGWWVIYALQNAITTHAIDNGIDDSITLDDSSVL